MFGVPDDKWGEVPVAYVQVKGGASVDEDELIDHCEQNLARFKRPRAIKFVDDFPKTPIGKIQKNVLREPYWAEQGEEDMSDRIPAITRLKFDWPAGSRSAHHHGQPGRLNAADAAMHEELVHVWRDIDADPDISAVDHHAAPARHFPAAATSISSRR